MRTREALLVGVLLVGLLLFPALWQAHAAPLAAPAQLDPSIVQILAADEGRGGRLIPKWSGSGVLISADGLILTNCQVAMPRLIWDDPAFDYDLLIVALAGRPKKPPVPAYLAEVVQYDAGLDLALLRIAQTLDGSPVDTKKLKLPALPLGDSDALATGDALDIFGYDGAAGKPLSSVAGTVTGFSTGRGIKGRAWIRTDVQVEGGFSGGPAVNKDGQVVGIVAAGAAGDADEVVQCRYGEDTNRDGVVDPNDACAATGGTIGTLRPVNLAQPLIKAAAGAVAPEPTPVPQPKPTRPAPAVKARVGRLIFAPDVDEYDQPVTVVESFPSGAEAIYLFFDYENFEDGATWQPLLSIDGELQRNVWPAARWDGGARGTAWISLSPEEPLDDGTYEFTITYEGTQLGSATVEVGGPADKGPTFSHIVFSAGGEEGYLLPGGVTEIEAAFEYANMTRTTRWSYIGYYQGKEFSRGEGSPMTRASGSNAVSMTNKKGFDPGIYRLELYIEDRLAATADCLVGEKKGARELFGPITFAEGADRQGNPVRPGTAFKSGLSELYAFFDYDGMQDGWEWGWQWTINGEALRLQKRTWEKGASGQNQWIRVYSDDVLPDGTYQLDLYVKGEKVQSGSCTVGGKVPKPTPTPRRPTRQEGVEIYGRIVDADTGRGIAGAYFVVLQPGITVAEFEGDENQVYTMAETDRQGNFRLPDPLTRGEFYSIIIVAQGYRPIAEDDVYVDEDTESPLEVTVKLRRAR
jgi:S1-C subfamily serine protease